MARDEPGFTVRQWSDGILDSVSSSIKVNQKWESGENEAHTTEGVLQIQSSAVLE